MYDRIPRVKESFETLEKQLTNTTTAYAKYNLNQYVIKSSFNSAYKNDKTISIETVKHVLKKGFRFLDFEIYSSNDDAVVGFSSIKMNEHLESSNTVSFSLIMEAISENAFSTSNGKDPLFLHFRVKSKNNTIFRIMKNAIQNSFGNHRIYKPSPDVDIGLVPLSGMLGKVICILDLNYTPHCSSDCEELMKVIAVCSNSSSFKTNTESETKGQTKINISRVSSTDLQTNVKEWKMVTPDLGALYSGSNYTDFHDLIKNHSVQIIPYQCYVEDESLGLYEKFFERQNNAIVTLSNTLTFIELNG